MSERLMIIVTNSDPRNACEISEPIYHATVAASMDYQVELIFSGRAGEIVVKETAKEVPMVKDDSKTIYDLIREAHENGVAIKATKLMTKRWGTELLPEVEDIVGGGYLISEAMRESTVTLTY